MIRASASEGLSSGLVGHRTSMLLVTSLLAVVGALIGGVAAVFATLAVSPPGVAMNVADGAMDLPLESTVLVRPQGWDPRFEAARLEETVLDRDGRRGAPREVPLQAEVLRADWKPNLTEVALRPATGSLRPDGAYRLVLRGTALEPTFPWPQQAPWEREIHFSTPASPRAQPAPLPARLKWEEPLPIRWSVPIAEFQYGVSPDATTRSWVNPQDRRESWVLIENPDDEATYQVTLTGARAENGTDLQHRESYTVIAPARPRLLLEGDDPLPLEVGTPLQLRWNVPIERMAWEINPPATVTWQAERRDPSIIELRFEGLEQGTTYELTIGEAYARGGAPLVEPRTLELVTPPKLMVEDLETGTTGRASVKTQPVLMFAEPIRDRNVAQAAITIEPALPGRFEWIDDRQVRWLPAKNLPYDRTITFRVKPGPDGSRSVRGGYFERPAVLSFTTELDKIIDVDVTRQVMTLIQEGRAVHTLPVATGVPGADTPIGQFNVQYKMQQARFRGTNVNGSRYDIGDVNWVLAFQGDYTIHGAYWRSNFGAPGSNGCVSLTDANAKLVYDWAPEGTLVRIHY